MTNKIFEVSSGFGDELVISDNRTGVKIVFTPAANNNSLRVEIFNSIIRCKINGNYNNITVVPET